MTERAPQSQPFHHQDNHYSYSNKWPLYQIWVVLYFFLLIPYENICPTVASLSSMKRLSSYCWHFWTLDRLWPFWTDTPGVCAFVQCILETQRPIVRAGPPNVFGMFMLTGGGMEGWNRVEQDSGWDVRESFLISHNPPLCFGPTRKLLLEQIYTSLTV